MGKKKKTSSGQQSILSLGFLNFSQANSNSASRIKVIDLSSDSESNNNANSLNRSIAGNKSVNPNNKSDKDIINKSNQPNDNKIRLQDKSDPGSDAENVNPSLLNKKKDKQKRSYNKNNQMQNNYINNQG